MDHTRRRYVGLTNCGPGYSDGILAPKFRTVEYGVILYVTISDSFAHLAEHPSVTRLE